MRALLKSGDTPKIILYTNTARNKDIYRLAGNYLQTLNWKEDVNLMRQIEAFYIKADALESLSAFYASCAQVLDFMGKTLFFKGFPYLKYPTYIPTP